MIFQAIVTKYVGPTNHRGSRVKATAAAGSMTLSWDCSLNSEANHARAALALAAKLQWDGKYVGGGMPDGRGNCYVNAGPGCIDPEFEVAGTMRYLAGLRTEAE